MNIVLVAIHPHPSPQAVPLACAFLKAHLEKIQPGRHRIEIVDRYAGADASAGAAAILDKRPDLVALSVYVWCREDALALARGLRRARPGVMLCAGGPEPTTAGEIFLGEGLCDFLVRGAGEAPFAAAVQALEEGRTLTGIPGVQVPGEAPAPLAFSVDPEEIPSPYLTGILDPTAVGGALWQLSRGCDFACSFCFDHKGGGGVRRVSLERIEAELRLFDRLEVPQVFVLDSTFNKIPSRAKEILRLIRRLAPGVHFHFEVRSEFLDPEMAELFASITCSLQIGLQSADPGVLRGVGRGFDRDDFVHRVSLLNQTGAIFGFDLIFGLPGDSLALFRESLDFALSLYPNHLDIFPLAVLPGTRLSTKAAALKLEYLDAPPYTVTVTPTFSGEELDQAQRLAAACDVFYSRGKAVAWFNAITQAVKLAPAQLLAEFARFLGARAGRGEEEVAEEEIWELQRGFLSEIFPARKKAKLLPLALDLVDYHHYYALALMAAPPRPPAPKELKKLDLRHRALALAPSAFLGRFSYEILDLLEAGDIELAPFASCFRPQASCAVIYPAQGEVCTESLDQAYYDLLASLDGSTATGELASRLKLLWRDTLPFLEFALSEGIVILR
ncbi:B12-binding domain-containing radical SAM protein [Geomonas silvestris]|uniref:B12-binding domain-containing radical SAM protein n=1 Tax=Geomonas silvestris TaxID=2740184 RepID=A0A6V8MG82_9BACT|nr:B12-binding domain-containing radical SAM protein [Geomonas silvestris]GFO58996.1 B12-binding domain-containing radical SAM protein [Geomonas silvestris]